MLEQHDDFAAAILRQQADDYEQTLLNAYPDTPSSMETALSPVSKTGTSPTASPIISLRV